MKTKIDKIIIRNFTPSIKQIKFLKSISSNIKFDNIIPFQDRKSFVYLITTKADNCLFFKLGKANSPKNRLKELQTAHYSKLTLSYTLQCKNNTEAHHVEKMCHNKLSKMKEVEKLRGEWFTGNPIFVIGFIEGYYKTGKKLGFYNPESKWYLR
jgi:hypothetical protein